ncbi:unnamed protein product [Auanema sp. JU1783]|nr:unnamed protein product [Auanema sp. JU1783]
MINEITVSKSCYDDFSIMSSCRTFEIIADNTPLYVNAGWLAELSPFFADYCFGETAQQQLRINDYTYSEVLECMRCIFFCPMRKPLTVHNVPLVLRFATQYDMDPVIARCDRFITQNVATLDRKRLFQVTRTLSRCDHNVTSMSVLVNRLASIKEDSLVEMNFNEMPGQVVAEVYKEKIRRREHATNKWLCPL